MIWALTVLLATTPAADPRPRLAELHLSGQTEAALIEAETRAQKLPILLMGPLTLCIFPNVFLALLGLDEGFQIG